MTVVDTIPPPFLDPGPLVDGDMELVAPDESMVGDVLEACRHPISVETDPRLGAATAEQLQAFLQSAPAGHDPGDPIMGRVPSYHFWMRLRGRNPPVRIAGGIGLRVGNTPDIEKYVGHVGYHVYPPARGAHLAERACRLLLPLVRRHGISPLWITCNPDNLASRRTLERLGARLIERIALPENHAFYLKGERYKLRYRVGDEE